MRSLALFAWIAILLGPTAFAQSYPVKPIKFVSPQPPGGTFDQEKPVGGSARSYLEHFGMAEPPFRITPHPDFFFDGANRGATLEALMYAITNDEGIVKVSGEVGSGKTMLCRMLERALASDCDIVYLANPRLGPDDVPPVVYHTLNFNDTWTFNGTNYAYPFPGNPAGRRPAVTIHISVASASVALFAIAFLGEVLHLYHLFGALLVCGGITLVVTMGRPRKPSAAAARS